ncbi:MAG: hypothetical protein J3Q66DRAFT_285066, partial [Benniella sp.]
MDTSSLDGQAESPQLKNAGVGLKKDTTTTTTKPGVAATSCANCGTTSTPLWRRASDGQSICNACGLYYKARNSTRPPWLKRNMGPKKNESSGETDEGEESAKGGESNPGSKDSTMTEPPSQQQQSGRQNLVCANCRTTTTPLWRRDSSGNTICNACGLYYKLHNVHRPVTMKRAVIKRRKR